MMSRNAYDKVERSIKHQGVINAEGKYIEIPAILNHVWPNIALHIPRFCIYIGSRIAINDVHEGDEVKTAGWSIFENDSKSCQIPSGAPTTWVHIFLNTLDRSIELQMNRAAHLRRKV